MENTWLVEIIEAMKEIGGYGTYQDIYERIKARGKKDISNRKNWTAAVRAAIETHSSDSKAFNGKNDIFYAVLGLGNGVWGLRNFEPKENFVDVTEDDISFPEGKQKLKTHICRERNQKVIQIAKDRFKEKHGHLYCEACGFDFYKKYGKIGEDYIEGHHTIPVSELKEDDKTKPEDIILLCSYCHKMIHRKRPWLKKEELKELIKKQIDNS